MSQEPYESTVSNESGGCADATIADLVDRLESTVVQLRRLIECRSHEALQRPGSDGHWGVVEVLCYLRDWEAVVHDRVERVMAGDQPALDEPDTSMWPLEHEYGAQDSHVVFEELSGMRCSLIERLRELESGAWEAIARIGDAEITLRGLMERTAEHDARYVQEAREAVA